jgi:hypothetical protein
MIEMQTVALVEQAKTLVRFGKEIATIETDNKVVEVAVGAAVVVGVAAAVYLVVTGNGAKLKEAFSK